MVHNATVLAAVLAAMALAGCTSGSDGGGSDDGTTTGSDGSGGIGGNVTVGNSTANGTVSASYSATGTNGSAPADDSADVTIDNGAFVNSTVTVRVGGTVTWTHRDGPTPHTVTADDASFDSSPNCAPSVPPLPPTGDCLTDGETYSTTFATAGTYTYHCKVHPTMTGTVQVVA